MVIVTVVMVIVSSDCGDSGVTVVMVVIVTVVIVVIVTVVIVTVVMVVIVTVGR